MKFTSISALAHYIGVDPSIVGKAIANYKPLKGYKIIKDMNTDYEIENKKYPLTVVTTDIFKYEGKKH